ncbi:hypothetical protein CgunFtcFv8_011493 [Champsocephalus gunnari]|uniref:Uncharacterized protein n=1 Tax=Champsocephalus gunnari TaxID=52237 RepID=A0AAN8D525_CHAGU|nr:hypothetical protein CgunFtcFv8_011493 [Champsocephalus gunnari]
MSVERQAVPGALPSFSPPFPPKASPPCVSSSVVPPPTHLLAVPGPRPGPTEWPQSGLFVWTRPLAVSGLQKCERDKAVDRGADRNTAV